MFENLTNKLETIFKKLKGYGKLNEDNIKEALREVRIALLEADVNLNVVKVFIEKIKVRAIGQEVMSSLTPGQAVIKIVNQEMVSLMGESNSELNLKTQPPAIILVAGLQGAGKTTTVAKLARYLKENLNKKVAVVSCDIYRPAAIDQLKTLANEIDVEFLASTVNQDPVLIVNSAVETARRHFSDVLIVDSAGRLHIDNVMMQEIRRVHAALQPVETLFIVDSMMGQDAVNAARSFNDALPLTGVVLTKTDGDARGGAALSVRQVTGKPIKFMGTGEKTSALTPFHPDRIASRILGMGDVLSLIEEVEQKADKEKAQKFAKKLQQGKRFTLDDFQEQLQQMRNMGGIGNLLDKLPGMPGMQQKVDAEKGNREFIKLEAIIHSMTPQERRKPDVINGSRKKRIATGSGTQIQDVNRLLKQFTQMQKMMKKFSRKGGMQNFMRGMGGKMPPGGMPF
ncbi:MAG: signal recognition particle protein [Gammaproteobacteria bacterium RIFCSPLOWO2_02_47_7]|nr:MAG: signal recognition particle protein [Gammaproteobacteria bacterium RIFCSPLOWO2_02_47_7]